MCATDYTDEDWHEESDAQDDLQEDEEREEGCCFPGTCCMPGMHFRFECHTPEMVNDFVRRTMRGLP